MSGQDAQRGFIFQSLIALIECMERDDWDSVKVEPKTEREKVDIQLYKDDVILSAIQVKSSTKTFEKPQVEKWLNEIIADAPLAQEIKLYLVGDNYTGPCDSYIRRTPQVVRISFKNLKDNCVGKIVNYLINNNIDRDISVSDIKSIYNNIFSEIHHTTISDKCLSRDEIEAVLIKAIAPSKHHVIREYTLKLLYGLIEFRVDILITVLIGFISALLFREALTSFMDYIMRVFQSIIP